MKNGCGLPGGSLQFQTSVFQVVVVVVISIVDVYIVAIDVVVVAMAVVQILFLLNICRANTAGHSFEMRKICLFSIPTTIDFKSPTTIERISRSNPLLH